MGIDKFMSELEENLAKKKMEEIHEETCAEVACTEINEEIERLIEAETYEDSCGPEQDDDLIDAGIKHWSKVVHEQGYIEEDAELAVHDALADLIENYDLDDTPDYDASDEEKERWLSQFHAKIKYKLQDIGIEFSL